MSVDKSQWLPFYLPPHTACTFCYCRFLLTTAFASFHNKKVPCRNRACSLSDNSGQLRSTPIIRITSSALWASMTIAPKDLILRAHAFWSEVDSFPGILTSTYNETGHD